MNVLTCVNAMQRSLSDQREYIEVHRPTTTHLRTFVPTRTLSIEQRPTLVPPPLHPRTHTHTHTHTPADPTSEAESEVDALAE